MAANCCNRSHILHGFSLAVAILTLLLGIWIALDALLLGISVIALGSVLMYGVLEESADCVIIYIIVSIIIILSLLLIPVFFLIWSVAFQTEIVCDDVFNIKNLAIGVCVNVVFFLMVMVVFLYYKEITEKRRLQAKKIEVRRPLTV